MTSIGPTAAVYARMVLGPGDVTPVRPIQRPSHEGEDAARQRGTQTAGKGLGGQRYAPTQRLRVAPANVVELPVVKREQPSAPQPNTRQPQPFVPFLAQQIAQEGLPENASSTARRNKHEAVTDAYILASDDAAKILGPVRPKEIVV
ncbi:MAG: hypothetical protein OSB58_12100 [Alphaproteobacteria bacterium]|nr:hypothetical protein [Alphaproteobacteria bacterium]